MKKIVLYFCMSFILSCSGYTPILSTNNLDFYINNIENLSNDKITKQITKKLKNLRVKNSNKKIYNLKIKSKKDTIVASKDAKGDPLMYKMLVDVSVSVIYNQEEISKITLNEKFSFRNSSNNFDLNQYKRNIENNLINKISDDLILKLQIL